MIIAATILVICRSYLLPEITYKIITPIPVKANTEFLMTESFILPSSVHQLFCGKKANNDPYQCGYPDDKLKNHRSFYFGKSVLPYIQKKNIENCHCDR